MTSTAESTPSSLNSFKLTGVKCTNRHLGQGSYGYVEEYIYRELRCAGKKLMSVLREGTTKDEEKALYGNAANECVVLSKLKHPNIVQFLGVHFEGEDPAPILVMEYVPHTLSDFLDRHKKRAPQEITYGILVDVARALCYLHGGSPIIIHRDLSANNVLLTLDLRAKVSDLGTAKILNVSLTEKIERCKKMTKCPGTPAYMPLEACSEDSVYDETIDCFSYGVLILHILTGEWPVPNDKIHDEDHQTNDIHRRQQYIRKIDDNHPLLGLIYSCLDHKSKRPSAKVILDKVLEVQKQCCKQQSNRMTLLTELETNSERRAALERELGQLKDKQKRLDLLHSKEAEVKAMEIGKLEHENEMLRSLVEVRNNEQEALEKRVQSKDDMLYKKEEEISAMKQKMDQEINAVKKRVKEEIQAIQKQRDEEIQAHQKQIDEEMNAKETEIGAKEKEINDYKEKLVKKERLIDEAIRKNSQRAHEALHRSQSQRDAVMEYLRSGTQMHPLHHRAQQIKWSDGPRLPMGMTAPQCLLIKSSLYVGGGQTLSAEKDYRSLIFEYNTSESNGGKWNSPFPQCPTVYFGLGELNGKLVMVGGERETEDKKTIITGEVFMLDKKGTKWSGDIIPAMNRPRIRSCVVSHKGCIATCGGIENGDRDARESSSAVEIYRSESREWCIVTSLPVPRAALRVSIIHKTAYFLGGFYPSLTNPGKPNCISIELEDLFQADERNSRAWSNKIRDCPYESSTPASLCGSLVALGGLDSQSSPVDSIYAYSPAVKQWYLVDELPIPLCSATAITLSTGEIVVLGGRRGGDRNTDVYIGSLE